MATKLFTKYIHNNVATYRNPVLKSLDNITTDSNDNNLLKSQLESFFPIEAISYLN